MQITSIMCHETLLPVLQEASKLGSGQSDGLSLKLVLEHKKVIMLSDNPVLNEVAGFRTVKSLVREGMKLPELSQKLIGGDQMAYLFQSSGIFGLPKAMMITHKNGCPRGTVRRC
jgi:4-coumarate--CoA ligase